jgi:hypothetical protein
MHIVGARLDCENSLVSPTSSIVFHFMIALGCPRNRLARNSCIRILRCRFVAGRRLR